MPTQKAKLLQKYLQKSHIPNQFHKRSDTASILSSWNSSVPFFVIFCYFLFYFCFLHKKTFFYPWYFVQVKSGETFRHGSAFKDTQWALEDLRQSESTRVLGHLKDGWEIRNWERFGFGWERVGDLRWWGSLKMVSAGNKVKNLSSVNHTTEAIHHHHHHHHHHQALWHWALKELRH